MGTHISVDNSLEISIFQTFNFISVVSVGSVVPAVIPLGANMHGGSIPLVIFSSQIF